MFQCVMLMSTKNLFDIEKCYVMPLFENMVINLEFVNFSLEIMCIYKNQHQLCWI